MISYYLQQELPFVPVLPFDVEIFEPWHQLSHRLTVVATRLHLKCGPVRFPEFIDSKLHPHCKLIKEVRADSWLAAKKALGFELSQMQARMLAKRQTAKVLAERMVA